MSGDDQLTPPPVVWAQHSKVILITICLEDCKKPDIHIDKDKVYFKGVGGFYKKNHEVTINLYKEIDPEKSSYYVRPRNIEFILKKKEKGPFWPQLTKEKVKNHWLKFDFNKWDDDGSHDEEEEMSSVDLKNVLNKIHDFENTRSKTEGDGNEMDDEEADSDDSDLPDLE